jgi:hypothetical protein
MRCVRTPFDVGPLAAAAGDVIAERRAVLIGRKLQANDLGAVEIDNHALDGGDHFIAGKRILPGFELGMPDLGLDQIHFSGAALVLLEGGNLFRIGRPQKDGAIAVNPAGVVRGVAEIFHAVGSQLRFLVAGDVAQPKIPVANEGGALAVGRLRFVARSCRRFARFALDCAAVDLQVAFPVLSAQGERDRLLIRGKLEGHEGQVRRFVCFSCCGGERGGEFGVVECRLMRAARGVKEDELDSIRAGVAIPETIVV